MSNLKDFVIATPRPLPVIILADVSGSMEKDNKIGILNDAISEMLKTFCGEESLQAEIQVAVITFGGYDAKIHKNLQSARDITWESMQPYGRTPMGKAFDLARVMIEDSEVIPSRAYRPVLVLVSDGAPTDDWEESLQNLLQSKRASKATRFAMSIGDDADSSTLSLFLDDNEEKVFKANEAHEIKKFFRWVSMSVTARSQSASPNKEVLLKFSDIDDFEF